MDSLHNPLADMGSFTYLVAYALCTVGAIVAIRLQIALSDPSRGQPLPPVSTDRDPGEIAYLRGGGNELLRFTIFDLLQRGLLQITGATAATGKKKKSTDTIEVTDLGRGTPAISGRELESAALAFFAAPHTAEDVYKSELPAVAEREGTRRYAPLLANMLAGSSVRAAARRWGAYSALALFLLAAYRLWEALAKGHHNIAFVIVECIAALVAVAVASRTGRLSAYGTAYLKRLRTALLPMRTAAAPAGAALLPIFVAATGIGALANTPYAAVQKIFARGSGSGSSGCGSCSSGSSGSSCGGGGGCGGGCGGG